MVKFRGAVESQVRRWLDGTLANLFCENRKQDGFQMKRSLTIITALFLTAGVGIALADPPGAPYGLLCELLRNPEEAVITDPAPEFSWIVGDSRQVARQSAYQILVASTEQQLRANTGDLWDSGKVLSDVSTSVEYAGVTLAPNTAYWWKVRTWDAQGEVSPYSEPQVFVTGTFGDDGRTWPGESRWVHRADGHWVLENRQRGEYEKIKPERIVRLRDGHVFADFGKAAFATLELSAESSTDGDSLIVFLGERKRDDFTVHKEPGRTSIGFKRAVISLKPGRHVYLLELPRHVSHYPNSQVLAEHLPEVVPFRYVEIQANAGVVVDDLRQVALFYPFDMQQSRFKSSNDTLNQVWELCKYTLKATPFLSLYMDGNRERMPYEADAYIQQLGHYAVDREYAVARYTLNFLLFNASWPTEWQMHTVFMAWADYMATGDTELIESYYDELKAKTLIALAREDGLISTQTGLVTDDFLHSIHYEGSDFRDIVDWPPGSSANAGQGTASYQGTTVQGERDGYVFTPINTVVNAFHYRSLVLMAQMAEAVGKTDDAAFFHQRAEQVKESFNTLLLDRQRGVYVDGDETDHASLHANMFPLAFGMVPDEYVPTVVRHIKSRGMAASVYGAQYLLEALYNAGEARYALDLMASDAKRSWFNMIRVGSTMTTEAWDEMYKPNLTWNHAWGSAPANIIPRRMMGIEPLEPGYRKVKIKPQPDGLSYVDLKTPTIRGTIETTWSAAGGQYHLHVTIPANTTAQVWLPGASPDDISVGNETFSSHPEVRVVGSEDGFQICEIASGKYVFSGSLPPGT